MLPDSRSLATWAERLGSTGMGGGGWEEGVVRKDRWRRLRASSSGLRVELGTVLEMALLVGSIRNGRRVNVSESALGGGGGAIGAAIVC